MSELTLNEVEQENCRKFIEEHSKKCIYMRANASCSYIFFAGNIGNSVQAKCNGCGKEKSITDLDSW